MPVVSFCHFPTPVATSTRSRYSIKQLLKHEFFQEENSAAAFKVSLKVTKSVKSTLSIKMDISDKSGERTVVEFNFDLASDSPEELTKDMVSPKDKLCMQFFALQSARSNQNAQIWPK